MLNLANGSIKNIALTDGSVSLTYGDLIDFSVGGIEGDSLVGLVMNRDLATAVLYLTLLKEGISIALLDPTTSQLPWFDNPTLFIPTILSSTDNPELLVGDRKRFCLKNSNLFCYYLFSSNRGDSLKPKLVRNEQFVTINTSGSTGIPKLVCITSENLISNTQAICKALSLTEQDSSITTLPLHYTYGLSILNTHLYSGGTVYLTNTSVLDPKFSTLSDGFRPSTFSGVPYLYQLEKKLEYVDLRKPYLKRLTQAGGRLETLIQQEVLEVSASNQLDFYVMYGQTEATARISAFNLVERPNKLGSVGLPVGDTKIYTIPGNSSKELPGEIYVSGSGVTPGYINAWNNKFDYLEYQRSLHTGDLGYIDSEGYLFITGRSSRIAKLAGKRFNLDQVELQLIKNYKHNFTLVSDDSCIYACTEGQYSGKIRIEGIHPKHISIKTNISIPRKSNGKVDYTQLLNIVLL